MFSEYLQRLKMTTTVTTSTDEDYSDKFLNAPDSPMRGVNCPLCKNTGQITYIRDEDKTLWTKDCDCMKLRRNLVHIRESRLEDLVNKYTLEAYEEATPDNTVLKNKAVEYVKQSKPNDWFYISGQVGSGKSHLCVGMCSGFLMQGKTVRYMMWREDAPKLKALVNKAEEYEKVMKPFKSADVLYIDDFLKGSHITDADMNIAFELINHRYNLNKRTIISSEMSIGQIAPYDEAVASRILERSRMFCMIAPNHNWRKGRPK